MRENAREVSFANQKQLTVNEQKFLFCVLVAKVCAKFVIVNFFCTTKFYYLNFKWRQRGNEVVSE